MATYYARKSGNINATDVWATTPSGTAGAQTFAAGDVLVANSFTITVNVSTDLGSTGEVRNDTTGSATAGGSFSLSNGVTLTAKVIAGGSATCVTTASTVTATIVGDITGGSGGTNIAGVNHGSSGTLTVTGAITGGNGGGGFGVTIGGGTLNVTGNVSGGTGSTAPGINVTGSAVINVTGNVTGGSDGAAHGIISTQTSTITVTGNVNGGTGGSGVRQTSTGTVAVTGTVTGAAAVGVVNNGAGSVTITGRAKGGPLTTSAVGASNSTTGSLTVDELEFGDTGIPPTSGPTIVANKTSNVCLVYRTGGLGKKTLVDINSTTLLPAASDVRFGTTYNSGTTTGTCRVPSAANVLQGVLVDATTGSLMLTAADFWAYATSSATTAGSMGERLKNAATVTSTGQQIADAVGA